MRMGTTKTGPRGEEQQGRREARRPAGVSPGVIGVGPLGERRCWDAARKRWVALRLCLGAPLWAGLAGPRLDYTGTLAGLQSKSADVASRPQPSQAYCRSSILPLQ